MASIGSATLAIVTGENMLSRNLTESDIPQYAELYNKANYDDPEYHPRSEKEFRKIILAKQSMEGYFGAFDGERMIAAVNGKFTPGEYEGNKFPGFLNLTSKTQAIKK